MDEFAILLIARMFHRYFGVVLRDYVWTTGIGNTIEDCTIVFAYTGDLKFMDTYDIGNKPAVPGNTLKFRTPEQETPVNLSASQDNMDIEQENSVEKEDSNEKENSVSQESSVEKEDANEKENSVSQENSTEKENNEVSSDKENSAVKPTNRKMPHSSSSGVSRKPHKRHKQNRNLRSSP